MYNIYDQMLTYPYKYYALVFHAYGRIAFLLNFISNTKVTIVILNIFKYESSEIYVNQILNKAEY